MDAAELESTVLTGDEVNRLIREGSLEDVSAAALALVNATKEIERQLSASREAYHARIAHLTGLGVEIVAAKRDASTPADREWRRRATKALTIATRRLRAVREKQKQLNVAAHATRNATRVPAKQSVVVVEATSADEVAQRLQVSIAEGRRIVTVAVVGGRAIVVVDDGASTTVDGQARETG